MTISIPAQGVPEDELFATLEKYREHDLDTHGGRTWAYVYDPGRADVERIAKRAYLEYLTENALDPTVFPSLLRMENEVVGMAVDHLRGDESVVGNFTSGGTESCMLAVKTARDWARENRPEIELPEMILPVTAHAAFQKAAHYFDVKPVLVPIDPADWKADVGAIEAAITPNTILMVGSAVSYAHGVVDPIPQMGALARERGLLLHVDGCIGGFILPYFRRLGADVTDFDFAVPGVTSMSMDYHKYAYCPKGASVVLYRDAALRRHQLFACAEWTGYTVINTTFQSTKSGGPLAATWSVLNFVGDEGYLDIARRTRDATREIVSGIGLMDDLHVMGNPEASLVALTSDTVSVFHVIDEMRELRWFVQPQLGFMGSRENVHLSVTGASLPLVPALLRDLAGAVERARGLPDPTPDPGIVSLLQGLDPDTLDSATFDSLLAGAGIGDSAGLPDRTAGINAILNACPPALASRLLIEYFNRLYLPAPA